MPSATNDNRTVKSASPEVGSAPGPAGQIAINIQTSGGHTDAMKQVLGIIEKKVRNMEKKKGKLDDYQSRHNKGERLNQDQLEALAKYQEVTNNLEFARELLKNILALGQDLQKAAKKAARREQLQRDEQEQKRLKKVLELQFLLDRLGEDGVRQELLQGTAGGPSLLTEDDLSALDDFYKLVGPERDQTIRLTDQYQEASQHLWELMEGKDKPVAGTTYKALKDTLQRVIQSGYFDTAQNHQNGVCAVEEEEEEEQVITAIESSEAEEQAADTEGELVEEYAEPIAVEATEFVNRQFIPETTYGSSTPEQSDEWKSEPEVVSALPPPQPPVQTAPSPPMVNEPHPLTSVTPSPPSDPLLRKQVVQDLMAQMQGPYNFMQDSMLDFDGAPMDPAIVSAQPMKPPQNMDMPPMVCPPVHPDARLAQPNTVPVQPEPTQVPMVAPSPEAFSSPTPMYQPPHPSDPRPPQPETIDPIQASISLSTEQPPPSSALPPASQTQVFQPSPKPLHSSGINVNAAPFQSMQTVFNLNAPVPPANEADPIKQANQYPSSYNQGFSSQTQHSMEQPEMQADQLQSVVGAFHAQDQSLASAGGHQAMAQQSPGQGTGFGRPAQSFYNSRAMSRGGPRNSRGMINGYRGPSNGFRGGYDGYRPPFSNTPNSGYGQTQFNATRDYSNSNYQRDGYQQNYKRGAGQGPRGSARGNSQAIRS